MLSRRLLLTGASLTIAAIYFSKGSGPTAAATMGTFPVTHSKEEWRKLLTPEQYKILREEGTEYPNTSALLNEHRKGVFTCAGCDHDLFSSATKFESGTGWPSFWTPLDGAVGTSRDASAGMVRNEVHCNTCGGHLGHVFNDGPKPTGLRYCMNGFAMKFRQADV